MEDDNDDDFVLKVKDEQVEDSKPKARTTTTTTTTRRLPPRDNDPRPTARRLTGQEKREQADVLSSLEHLITAGSKLQRDAERRQEFRLSQEMFFEQQHAAPWVYTDEGEEMQWNTSTAPKNAPKEGSEKADSFKVSKRLVHTEDIRMYGEVGGMGKHGFAKRPWPKEPKKRAFKEELTLNNSDRNWEIEHGDSIHPLAFSSARLSQSDRAISQDELKDINGTNLHIPTTDTSLSKEQVPRALLIRGWERAVHAASMTIPSRVNPAAIIESSQQERFESQANHRTKQEEGIEGIPSSALFGGNVLGLGETMTDDDPIIPEATPVKVPPFAMKQRNTASDCSATRSKCISLGVSLKKVDLPPGFPNLTCPACFRTFEGVEQVRQHYYGPVPDGNKGCCWHKIPNKQLDVIAQVLETHVKSQVDEFLGLIMERAKERMIEPGNGQIGSKRRRLLNWHDILKFSETTFQSSHLIREPTADPRNGTHPLFETLQRKSNGVPLLLNPAVLDSARERLVDRYANLPL